MRTFYCARLIDSTELKQEKEFFAGVAKVYGPKMTHKYELIQKDRQDWLSEGDFNAIVMPQGCWSAQKLGNPKLN